jgi:nitroimidazol reductase NimA-like FMN-containing flavoprotein (pyridoxamine 5'-phosphate oxidase superfamily)
MPLPGKKAGQRKHFMDNATRETITRFLAHYDTLAIATEHEGQPFVTRAFYVEQSVNDTNLALYGTFITTSRKLANLRQNPRVGLFIGPDQPSAWLEATARARVLTDENASKAVFEQLGKKSAVAATFIARLPIVAVELQVNWLRITNIAANPMQTEVTFAFTPDSEEQEL